MDFTYESDKYVITSDNGGIVLSPKTKKIAGVLIFLHGLGDKPGYTFVPWFLQNDFLDSNIRVVLPCAPLAYSTINKIKTTSWFDIKTIPFSTDETYDLSIGEDEIINNTRVINDLIESEVNTNLAGDSKRLFIGGISQGCALALHCGLQYNRTIGGIIALSGFLLKITKESPENIDTPVLISHGEDDKLIIWIDSIKGYQRILNNARREIKPIKGLGHWIDYEHTHLMIKEFISNYLK